MGRSPRGGGPRYAPAATERCRKRRSGDATPPGSKNLRTLYLPLANSWKVMDNTRIRSIRLIAAGKARGPAEVYTGVGAGAA